MPGREGGAGGARKGWGPLSPPAEPYRLPNAPLSPPPTSSAVKQVFKDLEFLGWYTTGGPPDQSDIHVHKQVSLGSWDAPPPLVPPSCGL